MMKLSVSILLCVLMTGCALAPKSDITLTGEQRSALPVAEVVVYTEVPAQYTEIARITATSPGSATVAGQLKTDELVAFLKAEAAALGANAVIITQIKDEAVNERVSSYDGVQGSARNVVSYHKTAKALAVYVE